MSEVTRKMLVGALAGDRTAREELLERVRPRLILWVTTRLGPKLKEKVDPEDVVQEILIAVHKSLDRFEGDDDRAFIGWLFTIAENRIRDLAGHFGAKKRQEGDLPAPREQTTPSQGAERSEMSKRVRQALEGLSGPFRQVIRLRRFEEREVEEISRLMDRSPNAVRILYCRAVRALREEMGGE